MAGAEGVKELGMEQLQSWLGTLGISKESTEALTKCKMIGEELAEAELDELIEEGVSQDDAKRILHAMADYKPPPGKEDKSKEDGGKKPTEGKKVDLERLKLEAKLAEAQKLYKKLGDLKKAISMISLPVGYILQCKEELQKLPEEKKGPTQKKFTKFVKMRDDVLKTLRDMREDFPENSDNWRAIAEVHEGSMQVISANSNFTFGKMVTTHTSRIFREQRVAMGTMKDTKKALKALAV
mmetsp:Transcript_40889/g.65733  ORF Transcript_40889/g.65733 Transcript_40889/m.65733 type:complete len:239 (-) Transcript_40889:70-786(-)|eukprot:jgi/Bigna1/86321/estExt_fgenesh1_pg.C_90284